MNRLEYSVVATTFNDGKEIDAYMKSIISQTLLPSEIVIADGGSKDNTVAIINDYRKNTAIPIVVITGKRLNIAEGYNAAIKAAQCKFIGVTGIGNKYKGDYFEKLAQRLLDDNLDLVYSPVRGFDSNRYSEKYNNTFLNGEAGDMIAIATNHGSLLKKSVFEELGYFYEKFVYAGEDAEFYTLVKNAGYRTGIETSAFSLWITPQNRKELIKQAKNYTIAGLQICGFEELIKRSRNDIIKLGLFVLMIVLAFALLLVNPITAVIPLMLLGLYFIYRKLCNRDKSNIMILQRKYYSLYYVLKFRKYSDTEYRVRR